MVMLMCYILYYQREGSHPSGFEVGSSSSHVFLSCGRPGDLLKEEMACEGCLLVQLWLMSAFRYRVYS